MKTKSVPNFLPLLALVSLIAASTPLAARADEPSRLVNGLEAAGKAGIGCPVTGVFGLVSVIFGGAEIVASQITAEPILWATSSDYKFEDFSKFVADGYIGLTKDLATAACADNVKDLAAAIRHPAPTAAAVEDGTQDAKTLVDATTQYFPPGIVKIGQTQAQ